MDRCLFPGWMTRENLVTSTLIRTNLQVSPDNESTIQQPQTLIIALATQYWHVMHRHKKCFFFPTTRMEHVILHRENGCFLASNIRETAFLTICIHLILWLVLFIHSLDSDVSMKFTLEKVSRYHYEEWAITFLHMQFICIRTTGPPSLTKNQLVNKKNAQ